MYGINVRFIYFQVENDSGFRVPNFNLNRWNPEPPAGVNFLGLLPLKSGYEVASEQHTHTGKMTVSSQHKLRRRQNFKKGATFSKNVLSKFSILYICGSTYRKESFVKIFHFEIIAKIAKYQDNTVIIQNMQSKLNNLCYKYRFSNDLYQKVNFNSHR